jgi:hypothetical protein
MQSLTHRQIRRHYVMNNLPRVGSTRAASSGRQRTASAKGRASWIHFVHEWSVEARGIGRTLEEACTGAFPVPAALRVVSFRLSQRGGHWLAVAVLFRLVRRVSPESAAPRQLCPLRGAGLPAFPVSCPKRRDPPEMQPVMPRSVAASR